MHPFVFGVHVCVCVTNCMCLLDSCWVVLMLSSHYLPPCTGCKYMALIHIHNF